MKVTFGYDIVFVGKIELEVEVRDGEDEWAAVSRVRQGLKAEIDAQPVSRAAQSSHAKTVVEPL